MQEFFTAESEEASKVSQNKDDLKLLFYGKNIYFYSLKFAKVHRKMAIDSFYRCGSQIFSESENFPRSVSFRQIITQLRSSGGTFVTSQPSVLSHRDPTQSHL